MHCESITDRFPSTYRQKNLSRSQSFPVFVLLFRFTIPSYTEIFYGDSSLTVVLLQYSFPFRKILHTIFPANKQYRTFDVSLTYKSRAVSHDAMYSVDRISILTTLFSEEKLYPPIILAMCNVSRLPNHLTLDNIHGFFFSFSFLLPFLFIEENISRKFNSYPSKSSNNAHRCLAKHH